MAWVGKDCEYYMERKGILENGCIYKAGLIR